MNTSTLTRVAAIVLPLVLAGRCGAQIENGSFETGDFEGWEATDLGMPYYPLGVEDEGNGDGLIGTSSPNDGDYSAVLGFDGDGPGTISLVQDVFVPLDQPILRLDYTAGWNNSGLLDRTFTVVASPVGGGEALAELEVLRAAGDSSQDFGTPTTVAVDLSEFAGEEVELGLLWDVPESFTGPGLFDLDNLRLVGPKLSVLDKARLKVALHFAVEEHDSIQLDLVVPVPEGFEPLDEDVSVAIDGASVDVTLDESGVGTDEGVSLKLLPVPGHDGYRRLKLNCTHGDFAFDFDGLEDETTGPGGVTALVPLTVDIGGETIERELVAVWKAVEEVGGKASAKAGPEPWATSLAVQRNLAQPDHDTLKLKAAAFVDPGFDVDGQEVTVVIGGLTRTYELDAKGHGTSGTETIKVARDKANAARQVITLTGKLGDYADVSEDFTDADTPAEGVEVLLPVSVTVDGRETRAVVSTTWKAKAGKTGKAKG